ncbi:hypothetical protein HYU21_00795 [Candidatus Woesearchaeota archaeon]|nr:hypothetical protein [Candidatus Woesearchaeota archaeon]
MSKLDRTLDGIRHILLDDTRGLTIQELANQTKVSRVTAGMALMKMEGAGLLNVRVIGNCKLHYWKEKKR